MAHIRLEVKGKPGTITVSAFKNALDCWWAVLKDLDVAISGKAKGSGEWVITGLEVNSATLDAEGRSKIPAMNYAPDVVHASVNGLDQLRLGMTPPYLGPKGLSRVKKMGNMIGKEGVTGFVVSNTKESTKITQQTTANIIELLRESHAVLGSIEGRMETINLHKYSRFIVYLSRTKKAVECKFDVDSQLDEIKALMGKRVNVFGRIHFNSIGEPLSVDMLRLRRLREENELPTIDQISGSVPSIMDGLSTAEHFTEVRGG